MLKRKGLFLVAVLALMILGAGCAGGSTAPTPTPTPTPMPTPISSEEVSQRVQTALSNVQTLQGTALITTKSNARTFSARSLVWFKRPQSSRLEIVDVLEGGAGKGTIWVFDGQILTVYDPESNQITRIEDIPQAIGLLSMSPNMNLLLTQFMQIRPFLVDLDNTLRDFNAAIIGSDTIAGRQAQLLRLEPKQPKETIKYVLLWVQKEDWLPLKIQTISPNDLTTLDLEFEKVEINVPLSDDIFTLSPNPTPVVAVSPTPIR